MEKFQYFNGIKFTRDEKTGYYLNSTIRKRMHRYVWEYFNGEIPSGCCVHHIDHDRANNDISNLVLMKLSDHSTMHGNERAEKCIEEMKKNLIENAVPKSKEWHKSEEGKRWHSQHGENVAKNLSLVKYTCTFCGKVFETKNRYGKNQNRFCSNACKSAYRRKMGFDNVEKTCTVCGNKYTANKYQKTNFCSKECRLSNKRGDM